MDFWISFGHCFNANPFRDHFHDKTCIGINRKIIFTYNRCLKIHHLLFIPFNCLFFIRSSFPFLIPHFPNLFNFLHYPVNWIVVSPKLSIITKLKINRKSKEISFRSVLFLENIRVTSTYPVNRLISDIWKQTVPYSLSLSIFYSLPPILKFLFSISCYSLFPVFYFLYSLFATLFDFLFPLPNRIDEYIPPSIFKRFLFSTS